MGQSSIPILNRNGYSMFWLSSWDNLHSYSTNLNEDAFVREIFYYMVNDKYSSRFCFNKKNLFNFSDITGNNFLKTSDNKTISEFFFRFRKIPYYLSKVRILKFQNWFITYLYLYNYKKKVNNIFTKTRGSFNVFKFQKKNSFFFLEKKCNFFNSF